MGRTFICVLAVLASLAALAGCGDSSQSARLVAAAKKTSDLFDIFPSQPGSTVCTIPHGGPPSVGKTPLHGVCVTRVSPTKATVTFEERWTDFSSNVSTASTLRFKHTWRVVVTEQGAHAVESIGTIPPQQWK